MLIKATCITHLSDARYFAARGVDFLGFNLEEGAEGYLDPMYMKAIREWVEGPAIVGEFSTSPAATVREAAAFFGLDAVQVNAQTPLADLPLLTGLRVILEIEAESAAAAVERIMQQTQPYVHLFLLRFSEKSLPEIVLSDWTDLFARYPVLLQLDASPTVWRAWVDALKPQGISIIGAAEERVGVKSFDEVEAIFEELGV